MRQYLIGSWNNADSYDYSGEQLMGNRLGASREVPHFTASGQANVAKYGDNTEKKASTVSIKDRILPQFKRLQTLRTQMVDLEQEYKTTDMSIEEYSILRNVIMAKIQRAEILYKRAVSVVPKSYDEDDLDLYSEMPQDSDIYTPSSDFNPSPNDGYASEEYEEIGVEFIDSLSETNSLKNILKKACIITRKVIHYKHKISSYLQTLKEV